MEIYKSGEYKLVLKIPSCINEGCLLEEESKILKLTSEEAKILFRLYNKLGFESIEYLD